MITKKGYKNYRKQRYKKIQKIEVKIKTKIKIISNKQHDILQTKLLHYFAS